MSLKSLIHSSRRTPSSLKNQFRWKLVPGFIWKSVQSFRITLLIWGLVTAGCIFYLSQWMNFRQVAHRIDLLETYRSKLSSQLELLEVEISYLTRPQRLEFLAGGTMLMQPPESVQYKLSWLDITGEKTKWVNHPVFKSTASNPVFWRFCFFLVYVFLRFWAEYFFYRSLRPITIFRKQNLNMNLR